jgi:hypothetical protein
MKKYQKISKIKIKEIYNDDHRQKGIDNSHTVS